MQVNTTFTKSAYIASVGVPLLMASLSSGRPSVASSYQGCAFHREEDLPQRDNTMAASSHAAAPQRYFSMSAEAANIISADLLPVLAKTISFVYDYSLLSRAERADGRPVVLPDIRIGGFVDPQEGHSYITIIDMYPGDKQSSAEYEDRLLEAVDEWLQKLPATESDVVLGRFGIRVEPL